MAGADTTVFDRIKSLRNFQDEYALNDAKIAKLQATDGEGHDPAAVKIVNEMQLAAAMANDATLPADQRAVAAHRYNLLNQVAKSYAIDRGMNAEVPAAYGAGAPPAAGTLPAPMTRNAGTQDPQQEFNDALAGLDAEGKLSPATGDIPRKDPPPLPTAAAAPAGGGVSEVDGFARTAGNIAGVKKGMETQAQKNVELEMNPRIAEATAEKTETGKGMGEAKNLYDDFMAAAPGLKTAGNKLYQLADAATYTMSGKARDMFLRQFNFDPGDSAAARAAMKNTIQVEVLPLLKATFGGNMSITEGEWLLATLGDDSLSPREKRAQIESRMEGWQREAERRARRTGAPAPDANMFAIDGAGATPAAAAGKAAPLSGAQQVGQHIFTLQKNGVSKQEAEEYLKLKGVIK